MKSSDLQPATTANASNRVEVFPMVQYVCETCSAVKGPQELWLLGLAAETVGVTSARREITIQSDWDRTTAVHPLAIHFCSMECKDEYMARLFAPQASVKEVVVERAAPVEVVVEQVVPEKRRIITKARKVRPRNEQLEDAKVTIRA